MYSLILRESSCQSQEHPCFQLLLLVPFSVWIPLFNQITQKNILTNFKLKRWIFWSVYKDVNKNFVQLFSNGWNLLISEIYIMGQTWNYLIEKKMWPTINNSLWHLHQGVYEHFWYYTHSKSLLYKTRVTVGGIRKIRMWVHSL